MTNEPLLKVSNLVKDYAVRQGFWNSGVKPIRAVNGVSFALEKGKTLSVVGESGSGKSTLARMIMRLIEPTSGEIFINGSSWLSTQGADVRAFRKRLQFVFQDPFSSINPRMRIHDVIAEPLRNFKICPRSEISDRVKTLLSQVGMPAQSMTRYPHEFSGGQRQRIVIARALASQPDLIVCDEAVSALDVSIQAQILNLLSEIQEASQVSYLFISHDLAVVQHISDDVAVMNRGEFVEQATAQQLFSSPQHPYTQKLLDSVPGAASRAARFS